MASNKRPFIQEKLLKRLDYLEIVDKVWRLS